jgi:hypothetical protein
MTVRVAEPHKAALVKRIILCCLGFQVSSWIDVVIVRLIEWATSAGGQSKVATARQIVLSTTFMVVASQVQLTAKMLTSNRARCNNPWQ